MIKIIKNWYKNLGKTKCPNCKSIKLTQIDKKFLKETTKGIYEKEDPRSSMHQNNPHSYEKLIDVAVYNIYDIRFRCQQCNCEFNKDIEIFKSYKHD